MTARAIIIDTDPGQDDAVAILLALASPELEVRGVTAVAGNVPLPLTDAQRPHRRANWPGAPDVPVYAGADRPLVRPLVTAEYVHGKHRPRRGRPARAHHAAPGPARRRLPGRVLRQSPPGTITLCPLGPLTNVALALQQAPEIAGRVRRDRADGRRLLEGGNITPAAEFNIYVDPQAADIVFSAACR